MSLVSKINRGGVCSGFNIASKKQELYVLSDKLRALADALPAASNSLKLWSEGCSIINKMYKDSSSLSRLIRKETHRD